MKFYKNIWTKQSKIQYEFTDSDSLMSIFFKSRQSVLLALTVCLLLPTLLISLHVRTYHLFSPIDESAHYGYVVSLDQGHFPRHGDIIPASALRELACQGGDLGSFKFPACLQKIITPAEFPGGGYLTEAIQPPLYYAITAVLRSFFTHLTSVSVFKLVRLTGILWLSAGLLLLWCSAMLLNIRESRAALAIFLIACSPMTIYYSSIISNDASAIFAGSLVLFTSLMKIANRLKNPKLSLFSVGLFVVLLKPVFVAAVIACSLLLFIFCDSKKESELGAGKIKRSLSKIHSNGGQLLCGGVLGSLCWYIFESLLSYMSTPKPSTFGPIVPVFYYPATAIDSLGSTASGISSGSYDPLSLNSIANNANIIWIGIILTLIVFYFQISAGLSIVFAKDKVLLNWIGFLIIPSIYVTNLFLNFMQYLASGESMNGMARYGLCGASFEVICLIGLIKSRKLIYFTFILCITSLIIDILVMS